MKIYAEISADDLISAHHWSLRAAVNSQLPHFRLKSGTFHAEASGCPIGAADNPLRLGQSAQNMLTLSLQERLGLAGRFLPSAS